MIIKKIKINNYRNLDNCSLTFDEECNFIVGENNIGKSNALKLLNILFNSRAFSFDDFSTAQNPIEIKLKLQLTPVEIGHFEDLFDIEDSSIINIRCTQLSPDDNLEFHHSETGTYILPSLIKNINFVYYDSIRNPISEISFEKGRGAGKFLVNLVKGYLETEEQTSSDFIDESKLTELLGDINSKLKKIKGFAEYNINATVDDELERLLPNMITLKDSNGNLLNKTGYGIQFLILVTLSVLEKIQFILDKRRDKGIFENEETSGKEISLLIGLDEPEIHLHPYMQRSLIKYLTKVISNENQNFKELIKELFDIDKINGQIIIATHSPSIILKDYKQIIRFYIDENQKTKVISGQDLNLSPQLSNHLYLRFPFIKEAFFSKAVIFVEGDSEEGSFDTFANKSGVNLDDLGIGVIQTRGGKIRTIEILIDLVSKFKIKAVGIGDKDDTESVPHPLYITDKRDFEEEIVGLLEVGKENILRDIVKDYENEQATIQFSKLNKCNRTYNLSLPDFTQNLTLSNITATDQNNLKVFYLAWFGSNKGYPLGKFISDRLELDEIPQIYKTVITKSKELLLNE